jgi:hypothetical protein
MKLAVLFSVFFCPSGKDISHDDMVLTALNELHTNTLHLRITPFFNSKIKTL